MKSRIFITLIAILCLAISTVAHATMASWIYLDGQGFDVGVGAGGQVWVIGTDNNPWSYDGVSTWTKHAISGVTAERISVDRYGQPYVSTSTGGIYHYNISSGTWSSVTVPAAVLDLAVGGIGSNETLWYCSSADGNLRYSTNGGSSWTDITVSGTGPYCSQTVSRVTVDQNGQLWLIESDGYFWHWTGSVLVGYGNPSSNNLQDLGYGIDGSLWATDTGHYIWHLTLTSPFGQRDGADGLAGNIAVDPQGQPRVTANYSGGGGNVFRYEMQQTLAVSDYNNGREMLFEQPLSSYSNGMSATQVLGTNNSGDFTSVDGGCSNSTTTGTSIIFGCQGESEWISEGGQVYLYIGDENWSRNLAFAPSYNVNQPEWPSSGSGAVTASFEVGEPNATAFGGKRYTNPCYQTTSTYPYQQSCGEDHGTYEDGMSRSPVTGDYAMVDEQGGRILLFHYPLGTTNGPMAYAVIGGQDSLDSSPQSHVYLIPNSPFIGDGYYDANGCVEPSCNPAAHKLNELPVCISYTNGTKNYYSPGGVNGFHNFNTMADGSGQNFTPTAHTLCGPAEAIFDNAGNLWVTDAGNARVLEFAPPFSTGMSASKVLGQGGSFTTASYPAAPSAVTASNFGTAQGMHFDQGGNLWVADANLGRVVMFAAPQTDNESATAQVGQANLTSTDGYLTGDCAHNGGVTQSTMCSPFDFGFDMSNNMYVADGDNNRVVVYEPPYGSTGINATYVLGMPSNGGASGYACCGDDDGNFTCNHTGSTPWTCWYNGAQPGGTTAAPASFSLPAGIAVFPGNLP
ncbi:MAG: hypothetical protein ACLQDV_01215 [Candidatus Binataceae bacterium]